MNQNQSVNEKIEFAALVQLLASLPKTTGTTSKVAAIPGKGAYAPSFASNSSQVENGNYGKLERNQQ